jgi:hypothetical protein
MYTARGKSPSCWANAAIEATSKEQGVSPPAPPLPPQHEPRGYRTVHPPAIAPGELPGHERAKGETGSRKPVIAKEKPKKRKEKGKTTTWQVKTEKGFKPQLQKTVKKPPTSTTVEKDTPVSVPRPWASQNLWNQSKRDALC